MFEERTKIAINQVVILVITEDGVVQEFVKDKKNYLPLLTETISDWKEKMWFIVVTFLNATIPNSNMNEIFIFSNPSFEKQVDCNNYVQVMNMDIYAKAAGL